MIEVVENYMFEIIVIDEIGIEFEVVVVWIIVECGV